MRTKVLLGLAVLAAGALTASAQIYSQNVVGYVNVQVDPGYSLIANPLNSTDNSVSNLFNGVVPAGATVYAWNGNFFEANIFDEFDLAWQRPNDQYPPGLGFFINNPSQTPFTVTFVGEVLQGNVSVDLPAQGGYKVVASKVPQAGYVEDLGLVPGAGDTIYLWNGNFFVAIINDEFDNVWQQVAPFDVDVNKGPMIGIGKSFFYQNAAGTATWVRNFTVQ